MPKLRISTKAPGLLTILAVCAFCALVPTGCTTSGPRPSVTEDYNTATVEFRLPKQGFDPVLEVLKTWIADARVVQLGELGHGDGTSFEQRIQLVRFLHEQLGFNVLALESGFFESRDVAAALASSWPIEQALALGVYPIYSLSAEMQPLFAYVRDHSTSEQPIRYWGFDPQPSSATSAERFVAGQSLADAHRDNQRIVETLKPVLRVHEQSSFWLQSLQNVAAMERSLYLRQGAPPFNPGDPEATLRHPLVVEGNNLRDLAMAESIHWILRSDTSAKIIVWAANNHVAYRHMQTSLPNDGETVARVPMGQHLRDSLGSDVFTMLTTTYEGDWALPGVERDGEWLWTSGTYPPASEGSLARKLAEAGTQLAIADVRKQLSTYTDRHELFGDASVKFGEFCDAVLFIRSMKPSTPIAE